MSEHIDTAAVDEKCPASGRTARWCLDQTHAACWAALKDSAEFDRRIERAQA